MVGCCAKASREAVAKLMSCDFVFGGSDALTPFLRDARSLYPRSVLSHVDINE